MNKTITVSAPGKLMLFGEHAVVYNHPCLVTAVDQRMRVTAEIIDTPEFHLEAPDVKVIGYKKTFSEIGKGDIPKGAQFVEIAVKNLLQRHPAPNVGSIGLKITTTSEFSSQFGFGSSSASTVCTIKAISELYNLKLSQKEIFDLAFKTVLDIQGKGSGFDVAAAVYGGTLYFVTGGKIIEPLDISELPLLVGYSGIKADTVTLINKVKETSDKYPEIIDGIYANIEILVERARQAIGKQDWKTVGELMNLNQGYLDALGVNTRKLADMIYAAKDAGAYGAKLSGAGGGDCIIGLAPEEKRKTVEEAITLTGGEIVSVKTNAEGVRLEK
ncbi:MAG TPA: mevalonate kinase [Candidatus Saccharimonadales bacterium]|nr:mevalonate kinase [Candidatus Saccharimonadales bacterium]